MKTAFFTLSITAVYRNLIFFPGSVVDRLRRLVRERDDLRLVFIVPKKDYPKYSALLAEDIGDKLRLEHVSVPYPATLLQKVFYFFYSYFIYTGTTRQLATLGVRPDEPPAGGRLRRFLAPLKFLIANIFGKSRFLRQNLIPALYLYVFPDRPFAPLFEKYRPELVFVSHIFGRLDTRLLAEARFWGVKTMGMVSNWDHFDKYYLPFKADTLLAQSEQVKDFAERYQGYDPGQIKIVGHPHFDFIADKSYIWSRERVLKSLGWPEKAKYILYVSGSSYCIDEPDIIETLLGWMSKKKFGCDLRLVIRPYLGGRAKDREFDEEKYNRFEEHPLAAFYRKEFWADTESSAHLLNIMRHADAVIAIYSTAMIEAAVLDRPLAGIGFDGYHRRPLRKSINRFAMREHFKDVMRSGGVYTAGNFEDLFSVLKSYLENPGFYAEGRERLRGRICRPLDGRASERIVSEIVKNM